MQTAAPEALDLSPGARGDAARCTALDEPKPATTRSSIGPAPFGRQCLIARRLIERGVRFVQIYNGGGHQQQNWDAHHGVEENLSIHCPEIDQPIAALLTDLERTRPARRDAGRSGAASSAASRSPAGGAGQIANPAAATTTPRASRMWLAGAGVKPGTLRRDRRARPRGRRRPPPHPRPARDDPAPDGPRPRTS